MQYTDFEPMLIVLGTVGIVFMVLYGFSIRSTLKSRRELPERRQQVVELLRNALGDFPVPEMSLAPIRPLSILRFFVTTFVVIAIPCFILYGITFSVVQRLWPDQLELITFRPALSIGALAVCFWLILPVFARMILFSSSDQALPKWLAALWQSIIFAELLGMLAIVVSPATLAVFDSSRLPYPFLFLVYLAALGFAIVTRPPLASARSAVYKRLEQADYEAALDRARFENVRFPDTPVTLYNVATVVLFAGRAVEADSLYRECIVAMLKTGQLMPIALTNFGYALLWQNHFEEARKLFEGVAQVYPTQGHAYAGLAEVYLLQGKEPASAFNTTQRFFDDKTLQKRRENKGQLLASLLADAAWAQAMLGRNSDARKTLVLAFDRASKKSRPSLAGLYYRAGQVMRLTGNQDKAVEYFEHSRTIDPQGAYGAFAVKALEAMKNDASSKSIIAR